MCADRIFSLDHLDDYQKHFTVMNYRSDAELKVVNCSSVLLTPPLSVSS